MMFFLPILAAFIWGLSDLFSKRSTVVVSPFQYMVLTNLSGLLFFFSLPGIDLNHLIHPIFLAFVYLVSSYSFYMSLKHERLALVAPFFSCYVIVSVLLAAVFGGEYIPAFRGLGVVLVVLGSSLLAIEDLKKFKLANLKALFFASLTVIGWGIAGFYGKIISLWYNGFQTTFIVSVVFLIFSIPSVLLRKELLFPSHWENPFIAGFLMNIALVVYLFSLSFVDVSVAAPLANLSTFFAMLLGLTIEREKLAMHQIIGALLIIAGAGMVIM